MLSPEPRPVTRYLAVSWVRPIPQDQVTLCMAKVLDTLSHVLMPCLVEFVCVSDGSDGDLTAGWVLSGTDVADVERATIDLRLALLATCPWLGLDEPVDTAAWVSLPPARHTLRSTVRDCQGQILATVPVSWTAARRCGTRVALRVSASSVEQVVGETRYDAPPSVSTRVLGTISVHLDGSAEMLGALFTEDAPAGHALRCEPAGVQAQLDDLPAEVVAHLVSGPFRLRNAFPTRPTVHADDLFRFIGSSPTPHALVVGATGQGKTCFLANLADEAFRVREQVFAVDVADGAFADQVQWSARRHGDQPLTADFGDPRHRWTMQLTRPPEGVSAARWADDLFDLIRGVLWGSMPEEYFGPVGSRSMRTLIATCVRDPDGPLPLTVMPALLDTEDGTLRDEVLARIGDPALTRSFRREILPMLQAKDAGHSATWLISKFDPIIGVDAAARVLCAARDTVPLEDAVTSGQSIVLRVPAAELGDTAGRILVTVALHRCWLAVRRRGTTSSRLNVLVDEWQRYPSPTLAVMLAEGRKYGIRLVLANQNLSQLTPPMRDTVLGNVGALVCFRPGPADAGLLAPMFPEATGSDLVSLKPHTFAVLVGGEELRAVSPPPLVMSGTPAASS